jgi:hypothetical protein
LNDLYKPIFGKENIMISVELREFWFLSLAFCFPPGEGSKWRREIYHPATIESAHPSSKMRR